MLRNVSSNYDVVVGVFSRLRQGSQTVAPARCLFGLARYIDNRPPRDDEARPCALTSASPSMGFALNEGLYFYFYITESCWSQR